ncbi:hypothetical protein C8R47DRAFT_1249166 [Mycena vitilis]|nr:hypothetical protein C8R47DRAFT_1249166 [Mycena vitilis]
MSPLTQRIITQLFVRGWMYTVNAGSDLARACSYNPESVIYSPSDLDFPPVDAFGDAYIHKDIAPRRASELQEALPGTFFETPKVRTPRWLQKTATFQLGARHFDPSSKCSRLPVLICLPRCLRHTPELRLIPWPKSIHLLNSKTGSGIMSGSGGLPVAFASMDSPVLTIPRHGVPMPNVPFFFVRGRLLFSSGHASARALHTHDPVRGRIEMRRVSWGRRGSQPEVDGILSLATPGTKLDQRGSAIRVVRSTMGLEEAPSTWSAGCDGKWYSPEQAASMQCHVAAGRLHRGATPRSSAGGSPKLLCTAGFEAEQGQSGLEDEGRGSPASPPPAARGISGLRGLGGGEDVPGARALCVSPPMGSAHRPSVLSAGSIRVEGVGSVRATVSSDPVSAERDDLEGVLVAGHWQVKSGRLAAGDVVVVLALVAVLDVVWVKMELWAGENESTDYSTADTLGWEGGR